MQERTFDEALGGIYDAALDPERWQDALAGVAGFVGAERGSLGLTDLREGRSNTMVAYGIDPALIARWYQEYDQEDPWAAQGPALDEGGVASGREMLSEEALRSFRVYREFWEPNGVRDVVTTVIARRPVRRAFVSVYRGTERPLFGPLEVERMARLAPHLQRAAAIRHRLAEAEGLFLVESAVLDRLLAAVIVCDAERRVLRTNARAEALLRDGTVLLRRDGRLACRRMPQERRLRDLLRRATSGDEAGPPAAGALPLAGRPGERGLGAMVVPLAPRAGTSGLASLGGPAALVVVSEPDEPLHVPEGVLRDLHGLTPAESRLAAALAAGRTLKEHAEDVGVALGTARWRLKQVFAKTETRRQAELVALVLRSVALVDPAT